MGPHLGALDQQNHMLSPVPQTYQCLDIFLGGDSDQKREAWHRHTGEERVDESNIYTLDIY